MNRRNFLKGLAASIGVAATVPFVQAPEAVKQEAQTIAPEPVDERTWWVDNPYAYFFTSEAWEKANGRPYPTFAGPVYFESVRHNAHTESYERDFDSDGDA